MPVKDLSSDVHKTECLDQQVIQSDSRFNFPFEPYDIQLKLMETAYRCYESGKFALLESPTGTGKSLSLICSSLTWLFDHQNKERSDLEKAREELSTKIETLKKEEELSGDWLSAQTKIQDVNRSLSLVNQEIERLDKFRDKSEARRHAKLHDKGLEEYTAFNKTDKQKDATLSANLKISNTQPSMLMSSQSSETQDDDDIEKNVKGSDEDQVRPKIFYASRTHSQLSQFIGEVKRTKFADPMQDKTIKVTPLASRMNLCVNPEVVKLKDSSAINERCIEMQNETSANKKCPYLNISKVRKLKEDILGTVQDIEDILSRGRTLGSCPYYASRMAIPEAELVVLPYNNLLHHETRKASALDLKESVVVIDEAHNILETICSIHSASISGQQLVGSHTILSRYYMKYHSRMNPKNAAAIKMIVQCIVAIIRYLNDPKKHLADYENPKVVSVDDSFNGSIGMVTDQVSTQNVQTPSKRPHEELMVSVSKFIGASNIERFNVFKIIDYFNRSQLARKLLGSFSQDNSIDLDIDLADVKPIEDGKKPSQHLRDDSGQPNTKRRKTASAKKNSTTSDKTGDEEKVNSSLSDIDRTNLRFLKTSKLNVHEGLSTMTAYPMFTLVEFLKSLTNLCKDGKVLTVHYEDDFQSSMLKFILLNPSSQFEQMTRESRSIVLAGGTMQPFSEYVDLLFGPLKVDSSRLMQFSCGHVIKPEQISVVTLVYGPTGKPLELSYRTRSSLDTIDELGRTILNLSIVSPAGMVCFLPSYDYEQLCFDRWKRTGIITNIETKSKQVFREPRVASQLKPVLEEYGRVVERGRAKGRGALLFCVVGGKMSEGINFNDDLGRCIVMVGLPYANIKSCELQQKMIHYDALCQANGTQKQNQPSPGQQYYENLCIKGINQSIGRAIRHKDDYASIVLLDRRYFCKTTIRNGFPEWMRSSLKDFEKFGPMFGHVKNFFNRMDNFRLNQ